LKRKNWQWSELDEFKFEFMVNGSWKGEEGGGGGVAGKGKGVSCKCGRQGNNSSCKVNKKSIKEK
jgi:hypothetical protein